MIRVLFSLFTIYELSLGNRLLLQGPPSFLVPPGTTRAATTAPPLDPIAPGTTSAISIPALTTAPVAPVSLIPGGIAVIPSLEPPATRLDCNEYCYDTLNCPSKDQGCAMTTKTIHNPQENYLLNCGNTGSCVGAQFTFELGEAGVVEKLGPFVFSGAYAAYGATITIRSRQITKTAKLDQVKCTTETSCNDLTIILDGVDMGDCQCQRGACDNFNIVTVKPCGGCAVPELETKSAYLY